MSGAGPTGSWSYDGRGNVTTATSNGTTTTYNYASSNPEEVSSSSISGQPTTYYAYDGNGDATAITNTGTLSRQLGYDAQSRLVQVTLGSPITQTVALSYNAFGQRAGYSVTPTGAGQPSLAESFKYQGDQLAQVATTGTGITTPYTDTFVYTQDGTPLELLRQTASGTTPYWYVLDGQGNVVALSNGAGSVVDRYSYDQWGKLLSVSESVPQQLRYAGYWYDNELGWYWLSVRAYDPVLERFLQPDPSELEGLFNYIYTGDNPSDLGDASGLLPAPPEYGCLLPGSPPYTPYECDVAVGSAQWNFEVSHGGHVIELATRAALNFDDAAYQRYRAAQKLTGREMPGKLAVSAADAEARATAERATWASPEAWLGDADYTIVVVTHIDAQGQPSVGHGPAEGRYQIWTRRGKGARNVVRHPGDHTADEAEYLTVLAALNDLIGRIESSGSDPGQYSLTMYSRREIVVMQLSGEYRVHADGLRHLQANASVCLHRFGHVELVWKQGPAIDQLLR